MKDSKSVIGKLGMALAIANSIIIALADSKVTADEIISIVNTIMQGLGLDVVPPKAIKIKITPAGSLSITIDKSIVGKLQIKV